MDKRCLSKLPFSKLLLVSIPKFRHPSTVQETQPSWAEIRLGQTRAKIQSRPGAARSFASGS
jgi:hypothetical protein